MGQDQPGEGRQDQLVIESSKRVRRASATIDRLETPHPDQWITGEHYFGAFDDTTQRLLGVGQRSDDISVQPIIRRRASRPANRIERLVRLIAATSLLVFALVFFFEAITQGIARLVSGSQPAWHAVTIRVSAAPVPATVIVGEKERGQTPLSLVERCRGRSIRVRLVAEGYATWAWDGLCPAKGELDLSVELQRREP